MLQSNLLKQLPILNKYASIYENAILLQSLRWRKRRWAPVNASKKYFVPVKPEPKPEEQAELKISYPRYQTTIRALTNYFIEHVKAQEKAEIDETRQLSQKLEIEKIVKVNDEWNRETALIREARVKQEEEVRNNQKLELMLQLEAKEQERRQMAVQMVLQEQEESRNFISEDKLEQELEKALDGRFNYNFAIDQDGNQYVEMSDGQLQAKETGATQTKHMENV